MTENMPPTPPTPPTPPPIQPQPPQSPQSPQPQPGAPQPQPAYGAPQPVATPAPVYVQQSPPRRSLGVRILGKLATAFFLGLFVLSIVMNIYLIAVVAAQSVGPFEQETLTKGKENQVIAVHAVEGIIDGKQAKRFEKFYRHIAKDRNVRAVVLRVNSPGGGVSASDQICSMVRKLKKEHGKTVVVSMGGVAASGGYYISAPADEIIAESTTVTGSIGVLASWIVVKGTLEKIGAEAIIMRSSHARGWKADINPFNKPDDRQRARLQSLLDGMQEQFEKVVRQGRGAQRLKPRKVEYEMTIGEGDHARRITHSEIEPFNGKVYLADGALERGLIDAKGDLEDAIKRAKVLAKLTKPRVVRYSPRKGLLSELLTNKIASGGVEVGRGLLDELQTPQIQMIWKVE